MKKLAELIEYYLKKIFPTRVVFDDGSFIEFLNREAILYAEPDGHRMEVLWYFQRWRLRGRILYTNDICRWDSPHESETLPLNKKQEIQRKIAEYCQERSIPLELREKASDSN